MIVVPWVIGIGSLLTAAAVDGRWAVAVLGAGAAFTVLVLGIAMDRPGRPESPSSSRSVDVEARQIRRLQESIEGRKHRDT